MYNEISFNGGGVVSINIKNYTYYAYREYDDDFLNVSPKNEVLF